MKNSRIYCLLFAALIIVSALGGCGRSEADRERADSLVAAADALERQGYGALGTEAEIERYYIEALGNCREAAALGNDTKELSEHLTNNLVAIRNVVESQIAIAEGMPMAQRTLKRRLAVIDSVLAAE